MCLIVFAHQTVPDYRLILLANRDEFLDRPAERMKWWQDPEILAGRDVKGGGTWLGFTKRGSWAAITNYRDTRLPQKTETTRGDLPLILLKENLTSLRSLENLAPSMHTYSPCNLLYGDETGVAYLHNVDPEVSPRQLSPGIYGLSNHLLDTPWPKVRRTLAGFRQAIDKGDLDPMSLLGIMGDTTTAPDDELPYTGLPQYLEKAVSAPFITVDQPRYGTRVRTLLMIRDSGDVTVMEWGRDEEAPGVVVDFAIS